MVWRKRARLYILSILNYYEKIPKKITIFFFIIFLYISSNILINKIIYSNSDFNLGETNVLILGDSHPQTSLNPNLFNKAINLSQGSQPFIIDYWKLKKILKSNKIDTVILGLGPHNISNTVDLKFSDAKNANEMFGRSYSISNFKAIDNQIDIDYYKYIKTLIRQSGFYPKKDHYANLKGNFLDHNKSEIKNIKEKINDHFYLGKDNIGISKLAIQYLDSIVKLGNKEGATMVLSISPVYPKYYDQIPNEVLIEFEKIKNKYKSEAILIDALQRDYPDSLYLDADHLNIYGAEKYTQEVLQKLKSMNK